MTELHNLFTAEPVAVPGSRYRRRRALPGSGSVAWSPQASVGGGRRPAGPAGSGRAAGLLSVNLRIAVSGSGQTEAVTRRTALLSVIGVAVVVAVAVAAIVLRPPRHRTPAALVVSSPAAPLPTAPAKSAPPLDRGRASRLSSDLGAATLSGLHDAIALPGGQALNPAAAAGLKAQSPVTFDVGTFRDRGDGTATVTAHVTKPPGTWTVTLIDEDGRWKISLTEKAS